MRAKSGGSLIAAGALLAVVALAACATSVATVDNGDGGASLDASTDTSGSGYDATGDTLVPYDSGLPIDSGRGPDGAPPVFDSGFPGFDSGLPGLDSGLPGFDSSFPSLDGGFPSVCDPTMAKYVGECLSVSNPTECAPGCPSGQCCDLICLDSNGAPVCLPQ